MVKHNNNEYNSLYKYLLNIGSGSCSDWTTWSEFVHLGPDFYFVKWLFYVMWAVSTRFIFLKKSLNIVYLWLVDFIRNNLRLFG